MIPRPIRAKRMGPVETPLPRHQHRGDAGLDLHAAIRPGIRCRWPNGERVNDDGFLTRWLVRGGELVWPAEPADVLRLLPGASALIPCGWAFEIPEGYEGQVRGRSGLTEERLIVHLGTVDAGFRGEVCIHVENRSGVVQAIRTGDRIAQLVIAPVEVCAPVEVAELETSDRGESGFGSTGRA